MPRGIPNKKQKQEQLATRTGKYKVVEAESKEELEKILNEEWDNDHVLWDLATCSITDEEGTYLIYTAVLRCLPGAVKSYTHPRN